MANKQSKPSKLIKTKFKEAVKFLKKTAIQTDHSKKNLHAADWYIVTGTDKSGKTSLLKNSELHFYLSRKMESLTHEELNWWVSKYNVYLDFPSNYLATDQVATQKALSKLIKKHAYKKQPRGIIVVVSIKDIIQPNPDKNAEVTTLLAQFIENITKKFQQATPVYLVINKCDLLSGFQEFFSSYAKDERQQSWGFTLTPSSNMTATLTQEFDQLTNRLNQQLIWRLHHEPDADKKSAIQDFPIQLASIKDAFLRFALSLTNNWGKANLQGIYFTSALQNTYNAPQSTLQKNVATLSNQLAAKAYFVHDLLDKTIPQFSGHASIAAPKNSGFPYYLPLMGAIGFAAMLFTISYTSEHQRFTETTQLLEEYKNTNRLGNNPIAQINDIKYLSTANNLFGTQPIWQKFLPGAKEDAALSHQVSQLYNAQLNQFIVPQIKQTLEQALANTGSDPALLYAALKSYEMLSGNHPFDKNYFYQTVSALWQNTSNKDPMLNDALLQQLQQILQHRTLTSLINPDLVSNARNVLTQLSPDELALAMTKSYFINEPMLTLNLNSNKEASSLFSFQNPDIGIPGFYTPAVYKQITGLLLTQISIAAIEGDWVIGPLNNQTNQTPTQLNLQLRQDYVLSYAKAWQTFVDNIQIKSFTNLDDLHIALTDLNSNTSPLIQLIHLLKNNIPQEIISTDSELNALATLNYNTQQQNNLETIMVNLSSLNDYLKDTSNRGIFELAKSRFLDNGENDPISNLLTLSTQYPAPMQTWLYQLGNNAWQLALTQTANYINQQWQREIWPQYQDQLSNRYPFDQDASQEVSLDSFANFFATNGLLDHFFMEYLLAFTNTNTNDWTLKSLNGEALPIKEESLRSFAHVAHLRRLFFANNDQHLLVPFSITPIKFSPTVYAASIQLGKQQAAFYSDKTNSPVRFTWPDDINKINFTLTFYDKHKSTAALNYPGVWGLWHFMQASNLNQNDPNTAPSGSISKDNNTLQFSVNLNQNDNPFNPDLFTNFKFNDQL